MWAIYYNDKGFIEKEVVSLDCLWSAIVVIEKIKKAEILKIEKEEEMKLLGNYSAWDLLLCGLATIEEFRNTPNGREVRLNNNKWYNVKDLDLKTF